MTFKPPILTEEEDTLHGSKFLTDDQRCDGCLAIAYQFHASFEEKHRNRPKSLGRLPQSEVIEVTGMFRFIMLQSARFFKFMKIKLTFPYFFPEFLFCF